MAKEIKVFDGFAIYAKSEVVNGKNNGMSQSWWRLTKFRDELTMEKDNIRNGTRVIFYYHDAGIKQNNGYIIQTYKQN